MADTWRNNETAIPHFREIVGHDPYRWQRRLYDAFVGGNIPEAVDIPTGLGKTLCLVLFLLARLKNAALPTRVVYVVDRRAIVDQTADAIRTWINRIDALPGLAKALDGISALPSDLPVQLGVLRGGLADDGEWRVDPARPAVVIGTVDMIGSRIMFSGYGDGRSRRPMHAGLLGHDSIVMLDEAHLSPAMVALIRAINRIQGHPKFRAMTLSATNTDTESVFRLLPWEEADPSVRKRLHAVKRSDFHLVEKPAARITRICELATEHQTGAIAVFTQTVEDAGKIAKKLAQSLGTGGVERVALLTGTLRGKERTELAAGSVWQHFLPSRDREEGIPSVFLVMTSAGEVGVDLDADHAVMDLATLDSMIQRLGRVNRTGLAQAKVAIVFTKKEEEEGSSKDPPGTHVQKFEAARANTLAVLRRLSDLSPATLRSIDRQAIENCFAPSVRLARLHAEVVEAFSATSATLQLPPVSVYLRGVSDAPDPPDSFLVWRRETPDLVRLGSDAAKEVVAFFRPHADEVARVPTRFARNLIERALERQDGGPLPLIVAQPRGEVLAVPLKNRDELPSLDHATVFLPTTAGGLDASGLPSISAANKVSDVADNDDRVRYMDPSDGREVEGGEGEQALPAWLDRAVEFRIPLHDVGEGGVEKRFLVYALRRSDPELQTGESDLTWLGASTQTIDEHCSLVGDAVRRIGTALALSAHEVDALEAAGRWHDRGKARRIWQRAAEVPADGPLLAKSAKGRFRPELLGGYRHEFGSLAQADRNIPMESPDRDLVLHLIASHHGWARPGFPEPRQWDPDVPSALNRRLAIGTADRFASLQAKYGPWRLAWLEALLKAADAYVSSRVGK